MRLLFPCLFSHQLAITLLVGVSAGGGGGPTLFAMGDHLEYEPIAVMMSVIIVFTLFCEASVSRAKNWIKQFNLLLQPCLDKVIAE